MPLFRGRHRGPGEGQPTTSNGGALPFIANHFISALEPLQCGAPVYRS
jgi:hypothetical protein